MSDESDVSRETSEQPRERRPSLDIAPLYDADAEDAEREAEAQAELDEAAAKLRAEDTARLTQNEFTNYQQAHAIIEPEEPDQPEPDGDELDENQE